MRRSRRQPIEVRQTCNGRLLGGRAAFGERRLLLSPFVFALQALLSTAGNLDILPGASFNDLDRGSSSAPGFLGSTQGWHQGPIYAVAWSQGSGSLASGATDSLVGVWNLSRGLFKQKPLRLEGHKGGVTALAFAHVGNTGGEVLISGSADNSSRIWDAHTGILQRQLEHPKTVFGIAVRPHVDESFAASAASVAEDNVQFATACWDGVIRFFSWPATSGTESVGELRGHEAGLYSVAFSSDGSLLASASADRTVRIWDVERRLLLWTLRSHRDHVTSVDWSPRDPFVLASASWDRRFRVWEIGTSEVESCLGSGKCSSSLAPRATAKHPQLVWRVAFAPGGELVAACHGAVGQSPTVVIYSVASGRVVRRLGRHKDTPLVIGWSPDGSMLASAGMDRKVLVYDAHAEVDDLSRGDIDSAEELAQWHEDLAGLHADRAENNTSANDTELLAGDPAAAVAASVPHPLAGFRAYM